MRPLTVINGVVLGSCLSIAVSLTAVMVVYLLLRDDYPRVQAEIQPLLASLLIFLGMTAISGVSFYALLTNRSKAIFLQFLMWGGLAATAWYYVP